MIDVLMLYCFSVAALVSVAAFAGERVVAALGLPRRAVWIGALSISLCLPLCMIATSDQIAPPTISTPPAPIEVAAIVASIPDTEMPLDLPSMATILKGVWILGSGGLLVFAFAGWIRLRIAAKKWTSEQIEGVEVHVADSLGPAVFGFFHPKIVVPRWLLDAPAADRTAAIAHERSHIAAGDTLLLLLGLLLIVLTPWNLPMWWQMRRLRFAIEVDCDQRVLRSGTSVASYGEMLLAVGQRKSRTPIGAIALIEPASQLEKRIRIMTRGTIRRVKLLVFVSLAMSASLVTVAAQLEAPSLSAITPNLFESSSARHEVSETEIPKTEMLAPQPAVNAEYVVPFVWAVTSQVSAKRRVINLAAADTGARSTQSAAETPAATEKLQTSPTNTPASMAMATPPKRIYTTLPVFPDAAHKAGIYGGFVDVAFTITVTGDVQQPEVRKSLPEGIFDEAALTAVRLWRFEPAVKEGVAVPTRQMIRLKFSQPTNSYHSVVAPQNSDAVAKGATIGPGPTPVSTGTRELINVNFTNIDVRTVLKLLADTSGQNIVISDNVSGKITLQLTNTPWDQALDAILREKWLFKRERGGIIYIDSIAAKTLL